VKPTLVILAAGVGSRYGGLKQLDPVGPGGAALMDYTMYDALQEGFGRVVLVIRRETEAEIRAHIEAGAARRLNVEYAFQELDELPEGFVRPADRVKPWGTGHAVLMAAPFLDGPFVAANADDFYGRRAVAALATFLADTVGVEPPCWAMVGYRLRDTLPASGSVSRALCVQDKDGQLVKLQEILAIERAGNGARWEDERGVAHIQSLESLVSMNLWGFTPALTAELETGFGAFLEAGPGLKDEYYLPVAVGDAVSGGRAQVAVLDEGGRWCGMTSLEDRATTAEVLRELVAAGEYPERLWD
jgi:choline kinase